MSEKKKILFYTYLSIGHLNVCSSIASILLDKYHDEIEINFLVDEIWAKKLSIIDSRFKFNIYEASKKNEEDLITKTIKKLEDSLNLPYFDRTIEIYKTFYEKPDDLVFTDEQISKIINELKPDYILCDLISQMPSVIGSKIPHSFIISCNPLVLDIEDFPSMGLFVNTDEKEKIKSMKQNLENAIKGPKEKYESIFDIMNVKYNKKYPMFSPRSDYLSIYCYPKELDYYDDEIKKKYKLLQIDSALVKSRIPAPFELPEKFVKLPGKIIYVSLGSLFSCYYEKLQKLINVLAKLPYKYIVSKGPNGDKIKFPDNRFIGENFINQLAVLQVVDMMVSHGGNNTFTECFYFGVPAIILPVMADQINNAKRIEETGFGYHINLVSYTEEELKNKINKVLLDDSLTEKMKKISERIKYENKLEKVAVEFYNSIKNIKKNI
uniref:UDP-glycosyltransferase n=1 Tax=Polyphagotarsonemus latus TaxID=1204166 RepID=A0AAN0N7M6_9ACAR